MKRRPLDGAAHIAPRVRVQRAATAARHPSQSYSSTRRFRSPRSACRDAAPARWARCPASVGGNDCRLAISACRDRTRCSVRAVLAQAEEDGRAENNHSVTSARAHQRRMDHSSAQCHPAPSLSIATAPPKRPLVVLVSSLAPFSPPHRACRSLVPAPAPAHGRC